MHLVGGCEEVFGLARKPREIDMAGKGRGWSPTRIDIGGERVESIIISTQHLVCKLGEDADLI